MKTSLKKEQLNQNLKGESQPSRLRAKGIAFQAKGTECAKALRKERGWLMWGSEICQYSCDTEKRKRVWYGDGEIGRGKFILPHVDLALDFAFYYKSLGRCWKILRRDHVQDCIFKISNWPRWRLLGREEKRKERANVGGYFSNPGKRLMVCWIRGVAACMWRELDEFKICLGSWMECSSCIQYL